MPGQAVADSPAFCCSGCATAFALLGACGLGDFHRLRGDAPARPVGEVREDWAAWSDPAFSDLHTQLRPDGRRLITWAVTGIHCAACVWVLERLAFLEPGVEHALVDLSTVTLRVVYRPAETDPGRQAAVLARLGYRVLPYRSSAEIAERAAERRRLFLRTAVSAASALGSMHLAVNLYAGDLVRDLDPAARALFGWASVGAALPAAVYGAGPWWLALGAAIRGRGWSADATGAVVVVAGLGASVLGLVLGGPVYADAVAMFVALLLLGRLLLAQAQEQVRTAAGRLGGLLPELARLPDGGWRPAAALPVGSEIDVRPGERLPADGRATALPDGAAWIDGMVLTGEARHQAVHPGEPLFAGTVCVGGRIHLRVEAAGRATRVAGLIERAGVLGAGGEHPALSSWGRWVGAAALGGTVLLLGLGVAPATAWGRGLGVLMAACPCAVGLGLPLLRAHALGRAAARGILIRDPGVLDRLATIRHVVLDKTGTLTQGRMTVTAWEWRGTWTAEQQAGIIAWAAAVESRARHPLASALVAWAADRPAAAAGSAPEIADWAETPGAGIRATAGSGNLGQELRLGTSAFTGVDLGEGDGQAIGVAVDGRPVAVVRARDVLRADAAGFIAGLERAALTVHLASGDRIATTRALGRDLGLAQERVHGACSPEGKAELVQGLAGPVLMVGDGVNDAAALGAATVGVAVRGGLAAALEGSHVFIADADHALARIADLRAGAAVVRRRERLLVTWSWLYNGTAVVGALAGWWGPLGCALAMPASSLLAVWWARHGDPFAGGPGTPRDTRVSPGRS